MARNMPKQHKSAVSSGLGAIPYVHTSRAVMTQSREG